MSDFGRRTRVAKILLRILGLALFVKALRKKILILGHGIGPLDTGWGVFLCRIVCSLVDYISVRDRISYELLASWGFRDKTAYAFDLSVLLEPERALIRDRASPSHPRILGVSITPVFGTYYNQPEKDVLLVRKIAAALNTLMSAHPNLMVRLFVVKGSSKDDDVSITGSLLRGIVNQDRAEVVPYAPDPRRVLGQVGQCSLFLGMRYHSCLFAYVNSLPLISISYHPKNLVLAQELELPGRSVLSLDDVLTGKLDGRLMEMVALPTEFCSNLPLSSAKNRALGGFRGVKLG